MVIIVIDSADSAQICSSALSKLSLQIFLIDQSKFGPSSVFLYQMTTIPSQPGGEALETQLDAVAMSQYSQPFSDSQPKIKYFFFGLS